MFSRFFSLFAPFIAASAASAGCVPDPSQTIGTQTYTSPDGVKFTVTTSKCKPGSQVETRDVSRIIHDPFSLGIVDRDASECTDPVGTCYCGTVPCVDVVCSPFFVGNIQEVDCSNLTATILATLTGSFFLAGGEVKTMNMGTCEYGVANVGSTQVEYCWDDFANLSQSVSLHCPGHQAFCESGSFLELEVIFPGN